MCIAYRVTKLMSRIFLCLTSVVMVCSMSALAGDTGLAETLHTFRVERGKSCMVGHFHTSKGEGETEALALKDAQRTWMAFTSAEYGSDWGSYRKSASKIERCVRDAGLDKCTVIARPCKKAVRKRRVRYYKRKMRRKRHHRRYKRSKRKSHG